MSQSTLADQVARGLERLVAAGIPEDEARLDAELLARHLLGWERAAWLASRRDPAPRPFVAQYEALVARRAAREPIALITGAKEFWGLEFETKPGVLIPRPETELVVDEALDELKSVEAPRIADVGTGSGCLAVVLARELPLGRVVATDVSPLALDVARKNATKHGVSDRVRFVLTPFLDDIAETFTVIVSNPPYVPSAERPRLAPEVRTHEPAVALDGGAEGLDAIRELMARAPARLVAGGRLIVEFGWGQEEGVRRLARESGFEVLRIRADLQRIPRVAVLQGAARSAALPPSRNASLDRRSPGGGG